LLLFWPISRCYYSDPSLFIPVFMCRHLSWWSTSPGWWHGSREAYKDCLCCWWSPSSCSRDAEK